MSMTNPFPKLLWTLALGGLAGIGLGCVISVGPRDCSECGSTGCNSQQVGNDCRCDNGYQFANPNDPDDYLCERIPGKGGDASCGGEPNTYLEGDVCFCDPGYNWCDPNNPNDLSCCIDDNQFPDTDTDPTTPTTSGGTASDTADETADETGEPPGMCEEVDAPWNGVEPLAADCPPEGGLFFCSNTEAEGPAGSRFWECIDGEWVENPSWAEQDCQFTGNGEFAYGCVDTESEGVVSVCGDGPGTPCSGPECDGCATDDVIQYCVDGKLTEASCLFLCTEDPEAEITYDHGFCLSEGGTTDCFCCDSGEEGCPV